MFSGFKMNRFIGGNKPAASNKVNGGGKRKAEVSPRKMEPLTKKRSALGDLTNAVKKKGGLGGKDKPEAKEKVVVKVEPPKILTRAQSKSLSAQEDVVKEEKESTDSKNMEKDIAILKEKLAEKVQIGAGSKLPVRQARASRSRAIEQERENPAQEAPPRRLTRSSHSKLKLAEIVSPEEEADSSAYETALSTPESDGSQEVDSQNHKNEVLSLQQKLKMPDGVIDFDAETENDPFQVGLYAEDIFAYYRRREGRFNVKKYLDKQLELNRNMRSILIDWMVEVQESFELNHETMYLGVKLVDLFLSKTVVKREQLQLVGTTALYIAAKYDERCPPAIDDFCYICDDAYPQKEIIKMEIVILKSLNYDIGFPLSYRFLRRYSRCAKLEMETLTLARYILEMTLMEYDFIDVKDSMISASCLLLALVMKKVDNPWNKTLEHYSGYTKEDMFDLTHRLHAYLSSIPSHLKTIKAKYSHKVFFEAAKTPLPDEFKLY